MAVKTNIDPTTGLLSVQRSASNGQGGGAGHPFYRGDLGVSGLNASESQPYAKSPWVMSAIRTIIDPIKSVGLGFTMDGRRGEELVEDPILKQFWENPSVDKSGLMSCADLVTASLGWLLLHGSFFWVLDDTWLAGSNTRSKSPIMVVRPDKMLPICDRNNGSLIGWRYTDGGGGLHDLIPEQVIYKREWNPYDDIAGLPRWRSAQLAAEADLSAGRFAKSTMDNNGDSGDIIVARQGLLNEEQRDQIERALKQKAALARRGIRKPMFLAADIAIESPQIQAVDTAFVSQRMENRHEVYVAFGVPPSYASLTANYSVGAASDRYKLIEETCMPLGEFLEDAIEDVSRRLLTGKSSIYAALQWDDHSVMRQVREEKLKSATEMVDRGVSWRVAGEYLNLGLPRFTGDDLSTLPFNRQSISELLPSVELSEEPEPLEDEAVRELRNLFESAPQIEGKSEEQDPQRVQLWNNYQSKRAPWQKRFELKFTRLLTEARRETLENITNFYRPQPQEDKALHKNVLQLIFDVSGWLDSFLTQFNQISRLALAQAGIELIEDELDINDPLTQPPAAVEAVLQARSNHLSRTATDVWNDVRDVIADGIEEGDSLDALQERVRSKFNGISRARARTIAVTETAAAYETGRHLTMLEAGVEWKEWLTAADERVRTSHTIADGQVVRINEKFKVGNTELLHPAESGGAAEEVINCRCVTIAARAPQEDFNE